jgi:hypothetical protein
VVERNDELSIRPRVLLLLVAILAAVAAVLVFEVIRAAESQSGSTAPSTGSSVVPPGAEARFEISGHVVGLAPGLTKELAVTFTNPNTVQIYVTDLVVAIADESEPAGCPSTGNMTLHQATGITDTEPVTVPAGERVTVSSAPRAPSLSFRDLDVSQDECKGVSFDLTFTGQAHA